MKIYHTWFNRRCKSTRGFASQLNTNYLAKSYFFFTIVDNNRLHSLYYMRHLTFNWLLASKVGLTKSRLTNWRMSQTHLTTRIGSKFHMIGTLIHYGRAHSTNVLGDSEHCPYHAMNAHVI